MEGILMPHVKLSDVRKQLIADAVLLAGFAGSNDAAIELAQAVFPRKPWCLVRDWVIFGAAPERVYADIIVLDEQHRWEAGEWVRSSSLRSFIQDCLFETENTVYVLLGNGHRARKFLS